MSLTIEAVESYFRQRPYYFTDGKRFYANPSHRKAKGLQYIGRFCNAQKARQFYDEWPILHKGVKGGVNAKLRNL